METSVIKTESNKYIKFQSLDITEGLSEAPFQEISKKVETEHILLFAGKFNQNGQEFEVTKEDLSKMVENFQIRALGTEPPVDFSHKDEDIAAGWITDLTLSSGGESIMARIRWTPAGIEQIENRQFRYLSPSFTFDFFDGSTGKRFGPLIRGAGLTNIPFLRNLSPVVDLSEKGRSVGTKPKGEKKMSKETETISLADHNAQTKVLTSQINDLKDESVKLSDRVKELEPFEDKNKELAKEVAVLKGEKEKAEKEGQFNKLLSEGKAVEAQREAYLSGDMIKFADLSQPVNLSSKGNSGNKTSGEIKFADLPEDEQKFFYDNVTGMSEEEYVYFRDGKNPPKKGK